MEEEKVTTEVSEKKGLSIAALVLGIVSLVSSCIVYISVPCGILAIIFGIIGMKKGGKGMAVAGLVLGIIAVALVTILYLAVGCGISALDSAYELL